MILPLAIRRESTFRSITSDRRYDTLRSNVLETSEYKKGSLRAKWFAAVKRHQNKSVDDFLQNVRKRPPAVTKSGEAEPAKGWLRYFEREEVGEVTVGRVPAIAAGSSNQLASQT